MNEPDPAPERDPRISPLGRAPYRRGRWMGGSGSLLQVRRDQTTPSGDVESDPPLHEEIRDISFPVVVRGYDRRAVDAYVEQVNRVIAELEMKPVAPGGREVRAERVGEQTSGIPQRARETVQERSSPARGLRPRSPPPARRPRRQSSSSTRAPTPTA